jgi:hypothetical protein
MSWLVGPWPMAPHALAGLPNGLSFPEGPNRWAALIY